MPPKPAINPDTWESHQAELKTLYLGQGKSVREIITYMEENRDFVATKSQYEAIFKKWQYTKYLNPSQWQHVDNQIKKREAGGMESDVYHNGVLVAPKRLKKELSRNCNLPSWHPEAPCPQTPPGIEVRTPIEDYHWQLTPTAESPIVDHHWQRTPTSGVSITGYHCSLTSPVGNLPVFQFQRFLEQISRHENCLTWMNRFTQTPTPITPESGLSSLANPLLPTLLFQRSADQGAPAFEVIHSHMEPISMERTEGELVSNIQSLLGPFNHQALLVFFKYAAYLASNNLLTRNQEDLLLQWIIENVTLPTLQMLFSVNMPTTQAFAGAMFRSALRKKDVDVVRTLLACGVDARPIIHPYFRQTPLEFVASSGQPELVSILLEWGVGSNRHPETALAAALCGAAEICNIDIMRLLLEKGAQVNMPGYPMLGSAVACGARNGIDHGTLLETLKFLLNSGAGLEQRGDHNYPGGTALHCAVKSGNVELAHVLLERGADVRANSRVGRQGLTALQVASGVSNHELATKIVLLLLNAGADVNAPPGAGYNRPILDSAVSSGSVRLARMMLDAGADVDARYFTERRGVHRCYEVECTEITAMYTAVKLKRRRLEMVLLLLDAGADVNAPTTMCKHGLRDTVLAQAALQDDIDLVLLLLERGAAVNAPATICSKLEAEGNRYRDYHRMTALQAASRFGSTEVVKILLQAGADVNAPGVPPLTLAARRNTSKIARTLLAAGADVRVDHGCPAIISAVQAGNRETVQLLLAEGADVNKVWTSHVPSLKVAGELPPVGETPLSTAISNGWEDMVVDLMQAGAKIDTLPPTTLESAVQAGDIGEVSHLLGLGANVNKVCTNLDVRWVRNALPLATMIAIEEPGRNHEMFHLLLRAGADVNGSCPIPQKYDHDYSVYTTALLFATKRNHVELARELLEAGADVNYRPPRYKCRTPLVYASRGGNIELVQLLLCAEADVNSEDSLHRTALQAAAESGHLKIVRLLLDWGADVNAPAADRHGLTALQGAAIGGHLGIVRMLLEAGADPNGEAAERRGRTALQGAAEHGRLDVLQLLLNSKAEIRGWPARKAKRLAEREGHAVIAQILGRRIEELGDKQGAGVSSDEESSDEEYSDGGEEASSDWELWDLESHPE